MPRHRKRNLGPSTVAMYERILRRAFGSSSAPFYQLPEHCRTWPASCRSILRAAVKRHYEDVGLDPTELLAAIPSEWAPHRVVEIPGEDEASAYELEARKLPPGRRALALLPLAMGLRAAEALSLPRSAVQRALKSGSLTVMRKGGSEQALPARHAAPLFEELLAHPITKRRVSLRDSPIAPPRGRAWAFTREVLSAGKPIVAYHALHQLVRDLGTAAGIEGLRPHKLRHAFATRMMRDGATVPSIQWMLGHASINTTMIYLHPQGADAEKFLRTF